MVLRRPSKDSAEAWLPANNMVMTMMITLRITGPLQMRPIRYIANRSNLCERIRNSRAGRLQRANGFYDFADLLWTAGASFGARAAGLVFTVDFFAAVLTGGSEGVIFVTDFATFRLFTVSLVELALTAVPFSALAAGFLDDDDLDEGLAETRVVRSA